MRQLRILFLPVVFLILLSCGDESALRPEFTGDGTLLKEVKIGGETYYKYTYNDAGLVLEEKSKFHYSKYNYNGRNQLIQSDHYWDERIASSSSYVLEEAMQRTEWVNPDNTEKDVYTSYNYSRYGQLEKSVTFRINNNYTSSSTFTYNGIGQMKRRTFYHDNKASGYDEFYYDNSGNLIKKERFDIFTGGNTQLSTTTEYEFDNKNNPYYSFRGLMIPGENTNRNNITKEIYTLHFEVDDFIEPIQITEYNYEYNSNGYPVKRNDTFEYVYY